MLQPYSTIGGALNPASVKLISLRRIQSPNLANSLSCHLSPNAAPTGSGVQYIPESARAVINYFRALSWLPR
jgi:hypothetical protein